MSNRLVLGAMTFVLLSAGCGDDSGSPLVTAGGTATTTVAGSSGSTSTTAGGSGGEVGGCSVSVTGDVETSWIGPDDVSAFTTDYWYTEDELRQQHSMFGDPEGESFEDVMARRGQIVTFFLFNCQGSEGQLVSLIISSAATRDDFPHGPGTYAITSGMIVGDELGASDFSMIFALGGDDFWGLDSPGTLTISEWDGSHLVGEYSFGAVESFVDTPRHVMVTGTFELFCRTSTSC